MKVLLVDDSLSIRQGLHRLFSSLKRFEVVGEAADGGQALQAIPRLKPDLVILDLQMPRLNGLEVLQALQRQSWHGRVVVFTQHSEEAYRTKCRELGACAFFDKVAGFEDFHRLLRTLQRPLREGRKRSNAFF